MSPVLKRTLRYFLPYWWLLLLSALFSLVVGAMDGAFAYLVEPVLQRIFAGKDTTIFLLVPMGIVTLFLVRGVSRYIYDATIKLAGQKAIQDIRNDFFRLTTRQDMSFYNRQATGDLMSRMTNDISTMQEGMGQVVTGLFRDLISLAALLGVIFYRNWQLATISFVVFPLTIYPAQLIGKKIKNAARRSLDVMGGLGTTIQETFSGIKVIKAFGLEQQISERFEQENQNFLQQFKRYIKYSSLATPVTEMIVSLGVAAVIYVGGSQVMAGRMTPAELFSFIAAMIMLFTPVKKLQSSYNVMQRSAGAAERVFQTMDAQRSIVDKPDAVELARVSGRVEFQEVGFRYGDEPVLQGVNLTVAPGQMVALVGPSGSGKSTMAALLMRFYDVDQGAILLDGHDLRDISLVSLNRQFALVDQETTLFNDTIANNIRYGRPDASDAEVEAAARAAFADDFIQQLPEGYATNIGDRGARLSGGQRQRLCIARALIKDAPILILDEATSALDTESEKMVQQALENLMRNRTTFVIAHRLSTVQNADLIVVLEQGNILEVGSHADLVAGSGLYSRLHALQFSDQPEPVAA
ncbi:ABC transporter ATP-binding protein [Trichlorobacter sp.]|uniref:ABC transporter ATP-binding protein n=1 Tax=Trichlorobacter sp. TaxID=2911007 RepID=UPI002A366076|nr:ABC transporter transmembrane domain-containing protein [Trichlorobacter sp.]MDY0385346.1 ABC transporter transmembrane domain-containing protein [Trichlorobacter sp.]